MENWVDEVFRAELIEWRTWVADRNYILESERHKLRELVRWQSATEKTNMHQFNFLPTSESLSKKDVELAHRKTVKKLKIKKGRFTGGKYIAKKFSRPQQRSTSPRSWSSGSTFKMKDCFKGEMWASWWKNWSNFGRRRGEMKGGFSSDKTPFQSASTDVRSYPMQSHQNLYKTLKTFKAVVRPQKRTLSNLTLLWPCDFLQYSLYQAQ